MRTARYATPVNFISFQVCWFASVLGAANNISWLGPLLVGITVPLQIYLVISIAMVAVLLVPAADGSVAEARVAVGACSAVPQRLARRYRFRTSWRTRTTAGGSCRRSLATVP